MSSIKDKLSRSPIYILATYSSIIIFFIYTCCYAYRKPFTIGLYQGETFCGFDLKILYVLFEIIGYAISKFIGTYILPSMIKKRRIYYIIGLLTFSELSWIGFGLFPISLKIICVFCSGLPLGMIWGIIFSYIEGRRISEILNVGLSIALIISSGLVKSLGQYILDTFSITEYWIPSATGAFVYPIMLICSYLLNQIPEPNSLDKDARTERLPMNNQDKKFFIHNFFFGICTLILLYGSLTVFRELRDSFAADFWKELNLTNSLIYTKTEYPIAFLVLVMMSSIAFIKNNNLALNVIYIISFIGGLITIISTIIYINGIITPINWMILSGLGMYMGYIPFTYLIERLIASLQITTTAIFILYLADSFGYLGTTGVFMIKNFVKTPLSWETMVIYTAIFSSVVSMLSIIASYLYFKKHLNKLQIL